MQQQTTNSWKNTKKIKNHHIYCVEMQTIYMNGQCFKNYLLIILIGKAAHPSLMKSLQKVKMKILIKDAYLK